MLIGSHGRLSIAMAFAVAVLFTIAVLPAYAYDSNEIGHHMLSGFEQDTCSSGGQDHLSIVNYNHSSSPHYFAVTDIDYWGRKPNVASSPNIINHSYRSQLVSYREWTGSAWSTVNTVNASSWFTGGSGCWFLGSAHEIPDDVTLDDGAWVQHHMRYRVDVWGCDSGGCEYLQLFNDGYVDHWLQDP